MAFELITEQLSDDISDISPISEEVYSSMKASAIDPSNLRLTVDKGSYNYCNENCSSTGRVYIESTEFFNFVEATGKSIGECANDIMTFAQGSTPGLDNAEFHVVFPCDSTTKNILGVNDFGLAVNNYWPMEQIRGCRRYGIKVNFGHEGDPFTESVFTDIKRKIKEKSDNIKKSMDEKFRKKEEAKEKKKEEKRQANGQQMSEGAVDKCYEKAVKTNRKVAAMDDVADDVQNAFNAEKAALKLEYDAKKKAVTKKYKEALKKAAQDRINGK